MTKVSVIIPSYNRAGIVCRAVESALNQTRRPDEVILVDDGSTDKTHELITGRFGKRVRYIRQENAGVSAARNAGIMHATGSIVAFLDSDDFWEPNKLELQVPALQNADAILSATNWRWEHEPSGNHFRHIGSEDALSPSIAEYPLARLAFPKGHGILIQSCICPREALLQIGGFDSSYRISEDNDLIFRLGARGKFAILSEVLLVRHHSDSMNHLTNVSSLNWQRENLDNMIRIFARSVENASNYPRTQRRAISRRHARLLLDRAKVSAQTDEIADARRHAFLALRNSPNSLKNFLNSLVLYAFPQAGSGVCARRDCR